MNGLVVEDLRITGNETAFTAEPGSIVALLGAPGIGLSAMLQAIAGLRAADAGRVLLDGEPVTPGQVGVMPTPTHLFPELTAIENVAVPLLARGLPADTDRIDHVLAALALSPASRHNLVEQLSGGQQQRVAIARALVTASPLMCLDEPVTELDEASASIVIDVLRASVRDGAITVIATADRELAARCDQTHLLRSVVSSVTA